MTPHNTKNFSSRAAADIYIYIYIYIYVYQGVYLAKESLSQVVWVHISLDGSAFKGLHQKVINNTIIVFFYS